MDKIKYVTMLFFVSMMSINAYTQRNIVHNLIVSDSMQYLIADYPEEFPHLIWSFVNTELTILQEKSKENGYYMFFLADSINIIQQYVSKTKDAELYAKYNPMKEDDSGIYYTVEETTKKKDKGKELAIYINQELKKQLVVSVNVQKEGVYICKSFKPL